MGLVDLLDEEASVAAIYADIHRTADIAAALLSDEICDVLVYQRRWRYERLTAGRPAASYLIEVTQEDSFTFFGRRWPTSSHWLTTNR
jgi:hypothetical protein